MPKVDEIGPWSKKKLNLLNKYLQTYTSIMNTQRHWCSGFFYIDAFAGSVTPLDKETQQYIDGSPRVALNTKPAFDGFDFIDIQRGRYDQNLTPLKAEFPDKNIRLHLGDCNEILCKSILPQYPKGSTKRGFVFLDPYGLELDWNTVEFLGKRGVFDVFINFSVMGVIRQCSGQPPQGEEKAKIDRLMGTKDWIDQIYTDKNQFTLPGMEETLSNKQRRQVGLAERLAEYYRQRLLSCFKKVSKAVIMRNSVNGPLYALILASQAPIAVKRMNEIFKRDERRLNVC